jgi:hypothetical protein
VGDVARRPGEEVVHADRGPASSSSRSQTCEPSKSAPGHDGGLGSSTTAS